VQRHNKGSAIPRAPNHCGGVEKSQKCRKYFLQYNTFVSERPVSNVCAKLASCPGRHLTSLSPWVCVILSKIFQLLLSVVQLAFLVDVRHNYSSCFAASWSVVLKFYYDGAFSAVTESRHSFLRVLVSKVSDLETLNIAKKWFIKISIIQRFFVCCICG